MKVRQNDPCPCGSGRKFKKCCIEQHFKENSKTVKLSLSNYEFIKEHLTGQYKVKFDFFIVDKKGKHCFNSIVFFDKLEMHWKVSQNDIFDIDEVLINYFQGENITSFLKGIIERLKPLAFYPVQFDKAMNTCKLAVRQCKIDKNERAIAFSIVRPYIVHNFSPDWQHFWKTIINRVKFDPELTVQGFSRQEVVKGIKNLEPYFKYKWVRKKCYTPEKYRMGTYFRYQVDHKHESWFPVYHLIGLFLGWLCKDPGLNALVSIGLSIDELRYVQGGEKILKKITYPGMIHQANLAAYFARKKMLLEVEPAIGSGSNDIRIKYNEQTIDIEMKTIISNKLDIVITKEVKDKISKTPNSINHPIIMYFSVLEGSRNLSDYESGDNTNYLSTESKIELIDKDFFSKNNSNKISAIVIGTMSIDSGKGRFVQWKREKVIVNKQAINKISEKSINCIFFNESLGNTGPTFSMNSLFEFALKF